VFTSRRRVMGERGNSSERKRVREEREREGETSWGGRRMEACVPVL
jgi:hypothetical protein